MKYIRFKHRGFVVFDEAQSHKELAEMIGDDVVSAGFVRSVTGMPEGAIVCCGESDTLHRSAGGADTAALVQRLDPV